MTAETSNARGEWVLVPRELTQGMRSALARAVNASCNTDEWYAHTLAAAPPPPADAGPKTLPVPTHVYLTDKAAVIVGDPQRGWDEEGPEAHNCDAMGCATIGPHVLARVPFTDERAMLQPAEARGDVWDAIEVLRRTLANDDAGWAALCVVIQALAADGVQAAECPHEAWEEDGGWCKCVDCGHGWSARTAPPPSVPAEVRDAILDALNLVHAEGRARVESATAEMADRLAALAQQPAAVGEEIMVNAAHDVYTLPLQPSGLSSGPRFVVHVPAPEQQPAAVDEAMVERAAAAVMSAPPGISVEAYVRIVLEAAIATKHQEPTT